MFKSKNDNLNYGIMLQFLSFSFKFKGIQEWMSYNENKLIGRIELMSIYIYVDLLFYMMNNIVLYFYFVTGCAPQSQRYKSFWVVPQK